MEPLRPDQDELADREAVTSRRAGGGTGKTGGGNSVRPATLWLLLLLVLVLMATGGWTFWQQQQRLMELEEEVTEAGTTARQNSLRLGSVNRERSETGQAVSEQLSMLDSEMRKLWVIAHQRNQPAIESLQEEVKSFEQSVSGLENKIAGITETSESLVSRVDSVQSELDAIPDIDKRLREAEAARASMAERLESRMDKLAQDRRLALEEVMARLDGLSSEVDALSGSGDLEGEIQTIRERVNELESVVDSIDSARAQLTQRFVQLRNRVDSLSTNGGQ